MRRFCCLILITQAWTLADSLFERTVDRKSVSYLVLEDKKSGPWVTLLLIPAGQDSFKGSNYPVHISTKNFKEAAIILRKLDTALLSGRQIYIKLLGSKVIDWQVLPLTAKPA